jgi:DNA helicase II / ATP-dependent DNA helicase PcrA
MPDLSSLNPPQREAVLHGAGPLVVFAGAGSGKTRVITYRIAHLVEGGVPAERILAVTFTNKAAGELRARLMGLLRGAGTPWVGTFHAICARLLRRHAEHVGLNPKFVIYDDTDQKALLTRILRDLDIDERRFTPREMGRFIEQQKQKLHLPDDVEVHDAVAEIGLRVYRAYDAHMLQASALDFNDLLMRMVLGLRNSTALRHVLQQQWEHVLVDEFQDTNIAQLELTRVLCETHRNLFVVGDDDQSIYKWRGAERRNILDFRNSFADAKVVKLEQNYRSTAHILSAAMAIITRNEEREPKQLWTDNAPGEKVRVIKCGDERDEARAISETLHKLRDHGLKLSQMAVFYRTHAQSRVLEEEMRARNIAYRVIGGQRFYERSEVKDVLAYLRVIENPQDDVSLLRIINTPVRGIGKTTIDRVLDQAAQAGRSVWTTLRAAAIDELPKAASLKLRAFVALIEGYAEQAKTLGPHAIAEHVLESTGYLSALRAEDSVEADGRIENVQELLASLREFENEAETPTLSQYLELITLQTNADETDNFEKLTLMTVHAAKGLEFPVVWVAGLEERLFPLSRGPNGLSHEDIEEERRLAYVALTRAEKRLFLSYARTRMLHGERMLGIPSPFLDELPEQHIARISRVDDSLFGGNVPRSTLGSVMSGGPRYEYDAPARSVQNANAYPGRSSWSSGARVPARPGSTRPTPRRDTGTFLGAGGGRPVKPTRAPGESYVDRSDGDASGEIQPGMLVRHAKYGEGSVISVEYGKPIRVTVRFAGWGVKQIVSTYLEAAG